MKKGLTNPPTCGILNNVKRGYTPGADTETNCAKGRTETIRPEG
nr:MAG TPA: hypothetical protein [Caudoviricetes sp.]